MAKSIRKLSAAAAILVGISAGVTAFAPATAQSSLEMLSKLTPGLWEIRGRDGGPARSICVRDGSELLQIRHRGAGCNRFVVEDGASEVTVQYTCRGNGYGRTHIRRETATLAQIDSQGIAGGKPFQFAAEARRVSSCR